MDYLIRFVQVHESFRQPEIEALAALAQINVEFLSYSECSPFCLAKLPNEAAARSLIKRSISTKAIYELWGSGSTYDDLHEDVRRRTVTRWPQYRHNSFRFDFDTFQGTRPAHSQRQMIETFSYLNFLGPISMSHPQESFCIFEEYTLPSLDPHRIHLGRWISNSQRQAVWDYSLKRRCYISTTSMDSELALLTANLTLAGPGKVFYDPFVGTGSFPIACAHFGAVSVGSDIDGRVLRGKKGVDIASNFRQYGLLNRYLDSFISDLTHSPLRPGRFLDGMICDPPYGVREGLKVLGNRDGGGKEVLMINGQAAYLNEEYIPPKRPYSFDAMLVDILAFAALHLVDGGRLSLWMPTANDQDVEIAIPTHPALEIVSVCVQPFNKWRLTGSRRLLTYQRRPDAEAQDALPWSGEEAILGRTADDLNAFRKRYFQGFKPPLEVETHPPAND